MGVATEFTGDTETITAKAIGCRTTAVQRNLIPTTQPRGGNPRPSAHDLKCSTLAPPERTWYTQPPGSWITGH